MGTYVVSGLVLAVLAGLLSVSGSSAQVGVAPKDIPILPLSCVKPGEVIPQNPGACHLTKFRSGWPTVVLWGDSHAWQYIPALHRAAKGRKVNLVAFVMGGCPPLLVKTAKQNANYPSKCEANNALARVYVARLQRQQHDVKVILGAYWSGYRRASREMTLDALAPYLGYDEYTQERVRLFDRSTAPLFPALGRIGVPVDVISTTATEPRITAPCPEGDEPYGCDMLRVFAIHEETETRQWLRGLMTSLSGPSRLIDANSAFCDALVCHGLSDGIFTFYDYAHLSATRSRTLGRFFVPSLHGMR